MNTPKLDSGVTELVEIVMTGDRDKERLWKAMQAIYSEGVRQGESVSLSSAIKGKIYSLAREFDTLRDLFDNEGKRAWGIDMPEVNP